MLQLNSTSSRATVKRDEGNLQYHLRDFRFRAPSEHTIDGGAFDLEVQNIFQISSQISNNSVAISILFEADDDAPDYDFIADLRLQNIDRIYSTLNFVSEVRYADFIEWTNGKAKYAYEGSETYIPCYEYVDWFIVKEVRKINRKQLGEITDLFQHNPSFALGHGNNRAVQDLGTRQVVLTQAEDGKLPECFRIKDLGLG